MKLMFKALGSKRLKVKYDEMLSSFAFSFKLRRYGEAMDVRERCLKGLKDRLIERANIIQVGRCRLNLCLQARNQTTFALGI